MERAELARRLGTVLRTAEPRDRVIGEAEPARFIAAFAEAVADGGTVYLADPAWRETERAQFAALTASRPQPDAHRAGDTSGWLCLPTGGSSGALKLARHDESTLAAAVNGFCAHFGVHRVNAVGLLPLHHVSGLMAWLRCVLSGGCYTPWSWHELERGRRPARPEGDAFLSLVPTQLERLLHDQAAVAWLRGFRAVFIGGGPAWAELVERAAAARLPLAFSYGMTETAAMIAALRPEEFLAGRRGCGAALPHAQIRVQPDGRIEIAGASLFRGYWPERRPEGPWLTDDLGSFDAAGSLHLRGRRDLLIISGGEKIDPVEVEAALRASGEFADVAVVGVPSREWGTAVVAGYPGGGGRPDFARVESTLAERLAKFKWPKRYVAIDPWPRNAQGKVRRDRLLAALQTLPET